MLANWVKHTHVQEEKDSYRCEGEKGTEVERGGEINWKAAIFSIHSEEAIRPIVEFYVLCVFWDKRVAGWACSKVHSSSYLLFSSAHRFPVFLLVFFTMFAQLCVHHCVLCVSVYGYVCICLLSPLRSKTTSTLVVLTGREGLAPIMQCPCYWVCSLQC